MTDYRDTIIHRERPEKKGKFGYVVPRWWEVPEDEVAQHVVDVGTSLADSSGNRREAMLQHARLYENCALDSLDAREYAASVVRQIIAGQGLVSLNVCAGCVDTLTAKVTKNRPRPHILTTGGSWVQQLRARGLDKWCQGLFYQTKVYQKARQVFVDSCEFGTGFMQVSEGADGKLECERVLPNEIFVDDLDGQYGAPRQLLRRKWVSRDVLTRLFPKKADIIANAGKKERIEVAGAAPEVADNTVEVWEAWHLPSIEGADDGKHVIAVDGGCLFQEKWKVCQFPFIVLRFKKRTTGFWGKGVVETVQGIQLEINRSVKSISQQMRRKGKGRTYVQVGSKIQPQHMTNADGGDLIQYVGSPPIVESGNAISQEEFAYVRQLKADAYQEVGLSELSTAAKKPSGLDAAVALREYSDIESERFAIVHQDWEQFFLDYAELAIELITKQYGWSAYKVLVPGRRDLLEVDWKNVNMERDSYIMQMWPASTLPQTPAAKYERVQEMVNDGVIDRPTANRLLNFPDLDAENNLVNATLDDADATISAILDEEEPKIMPLEQYQNLDLIIQRANSAYLYARHRNCPEDRLALLRNLIDNATAQKVALSAPPPMPAGPMGPPPEMAGGMPGGMPGAPPITNNNTVNVPPAPPAPLVPPVIG